MPTGWSGLPQARALELFDAHIESAKEVLVADGIGIVFETPEGEKQISAETIIDAYLHGYYDRHGGEAANRLGFIESSLPGQGMAL